MIKKQFFRNRKRIERTKAGASQTANGGNKKLIYVHYRYLKRDN